MVDAPSAVECADLGMPDRRLDVVDRVSGAERALARSSLASLLEVTMVRAPHIAAGPCIFPISA
jgi:hypothetical protein